MLRNTVNTKIVVVSVIDTEKNLPAGVSFKKGSASFKLRKMSNCTHIYIQGG